MSQVPIPIDVTSRSADGKQEKLAPEYVGDWYPRMGTKQVHVAQVAQAVLDKGGTMEEAEKAAKVAFSAWKGEDKPIGYPGHNGQAFDEQEQMLSRYLKAMIHLSSGKTEGLTTQELLDAACLVKQPMANIEEWANNLLASRGK